MWCFGFPWYFYTGGFCCLLYTLMPYLIDKANISER